MKKQPENEKTTVIEGFTMYHRKISGDLNVNGLPALTTLVLTAPKDDRTRVEKLLDNIKAR